MSGKQFTQPKCSRCGDERPGMYERHYAGTDYVICSDTRMCDERVRQNVARQTNPDTPSRKRAREIIASARIAGDKLDYGFDLEAKIMAALDEAGKETVPATLRACLNVLIEGGTLVSSNECSTAEIAIARGGNRFYVDSNGLGYVARSKSKRPSEPGDYPKVHQIIAARDALDRMANLARGNDHVNVSELRKDLSEIESVLDTVEMGLPSETKPLCGTCGGAGFVGSLDAAETCPDCDRTGPCNDRLVRTQEHVMGGMYVEHVRLKREKQPTEEKPREPGAAAKLTDYELLMALICKATCEQHDHIVLVEVLPELERRLSARHTCGKPHPQAVLSCDICGYAMRPSDTVTLPTETRTGFIPVATLDKLIADFKDRCAYHRREEYEASRSRDSQRYLDHCRYADIWERAVDLIKDAVQDSTKDK